MSWQIRTPDTDPKSINDIYDCYPDLFTVILHHGGSLMKKGSELVYSEETTYVDCFDVDKFKFYQFNQVLTELGYDPQEPVVLRYLQPNIEMNVGLHLLDNDEDGFMMLTYMDSNNTREFNVYVEHPNKTGKRVLIQDIDENVSEGNAGSEASEGSEDGDYIETDEECGASWTWFLKCLGEDLDLCSNSNFTFISDRQKGLVHAVENLFPCAEHRHCLRHIHGNMKGSFRGVAYKNHLWRCATVTTVPEFEHAMNQLKEFDNAAYVWLSDIPPHQWARSHFTRRAVSDVLLSNMCEVFNRWLIDARDKPIVTALEYIREYCMKRIVNVIKKKSKCDGPLSIGAAKVFEKIKSEANKCTVLWGGNQKYQVSGPTINGQPAEQFVVDMETRTCACRKWELTGIPCKHAVAVNWNMVENGFEVGDPKTWVHSVYQLTTWNNTYQFTIELLNGRHLWSKSGDLYTLVAPKMISTPGRPKKKRRMSANEVDEIGEGGKLSTQGKLKKCGSCEEYGHNKRGCPKGKGDASTSGGGSVNKKGKTAAVGKMKK